MTQDRDTDPPIEIELKYEVLDRAAGQRYLVADQIAGFRASEPVKLVRMEDRYLDTHDGAIGRAGYAARLRSAHGQVIVAVKSSARPTGSGTVHRREEIEGPAHPSAAPDTWPPSAARSRLIELSGGAPLMEVVTVRQAREKRILERGETTVELSLDRISAVWDGRVVARFVELEVELTAGDEAALVDIEAVLAADPGLAPATTSKLARSLAAISNALGAPSARGRQPNRRGTASSGVKGLGAADTGSTARGPEAMEIPTPAAENGPVAEDTPLMAAAVGETLTPNAAAENLPDATPHAVVTAAPDPSPIATLPLTARTPGVQAEDTVAEAGRKVLRFHLARMVAREPGTREGSNPEELHGMRVATRRQRAAWRIFGRAFRPDRTKAHRARLREIGARLGAVRDLDVLIAGVDDYMAPLPEADRVALDPMLVAWRSERDAARARLVRELDSAGHRRWLERYAAFVEIEGKHTLPFEPAAPHRIADTAGSRILGAYEAVRAYGPVIGTASVPTLHELRIAGKWLRYSMEFVREALGSDVDELIARVTALQDHLGLMHDADVASALARTFLADRGWALTDPEVAAIERYAERNEQERDRLVTSLDPRFKALDGSSFRRRLGRALAEL